MGIFSNINTVGTDFDVPMAEGYSAEFNSELDIALESYDDQIAVVEAIYAYDMAELAESTGAVTEGAVKDKMKNIWLKIKEKLQALWAKVKAFFHRARQFMDALFMDANKFVAKYEKELTSRNLSGFKYKMYKYTNTLGEIGTETGTDVVTVVGNIKNIKSVEDGKKQLETLEKKIDDADDVRGNLVGDSSVSAGDFANELYKYYRDGSGSKNEQQEESINIKNIISDVKKLTSQKSNLVKAEGTINSNFNKLISGIDSASKKFGDIKFVEDEEVNKEIATIAVQVANKTTTMYSGILNINLASISAWKSAVNEQLRTYKSVCLKALGYKADKK